MQPDLPGIHAREKIGAQKRYQEHARAAESQKADGEKRAGESGTIPALHVALPHTPQIFLERKVKSAEEAGVV